MAYIHPEHHKAPRFGLNERVGLIRSDRVNLRNLWGCEQLQTKISVLSFPATGLTTYVQNGGKL